MAVIDLNENRVRELVDDGADINATDMDGVSDYIALLFCFIKRGFCIYLFEHIQSQTMYCYKPVCQTNLPRSQSSLVVSFLYLHQMTPLHMTAKKGHMRILGCLLDDPRALVDIKDRNGVNICNNDSG